jgi:hypothetical protein
MACRAALKNARRHPLRLAITLHSDSLGKEFLKLRKFQER